MSANDVPTEGETLVRERTFTTAEVEAFAALSGDEQPIHTTPDDDGRLVVHGLLTATLPTEIGGELEVLARSMEFEFLAPVYTGETIRCEVTTTAVDPREDRYDIVTDIVCRRVTDGSVVLRGGFDGLIWK
ncbi:MULTISPECIES: MaoC/PaaZ C-terminal domain-containing protein [Haloferax]|uniref:Dehydratase n=2 Tax=Haloferax TaxID=2251 RepID=A0A6G1Z072_9EURY|nr:MULTISPECIES: MaoC/PaaZ C-terminal domain-containing protein [Haloferax]KAB1187295.1 dehydratase [Haloferax sp. CBA1149]MRW79940.1 dehydratase [Haloferax marinisediminis]